MNKYIFDVTKQAQESIKEALEKRKTPGAFLRLGIRGGGCSGYQYCIEFYDGEPRKRDLVFEFGDVSVIIDKKSIILLNGCQLDYEKTLMYQGFKFNNPNSKGNCGCNESFSI